MSSATFPSQDVLKDYAHKVYRYALLDQSGNWGMDIGHWDWVPGVGVISILEYYEQCGQPEVLAELEQWANLQLHKSEQLKVINSMAPFAILPALYNHTGNPVFLEASERVGAWMLNEAPRTREGAFEHTVTENASFPEQVWADTIFMAVLFLARLGRLTGHTLYAAEAVHQLELHLKLLQDEASGILFHGWNSIAGNHMSAARWTRANAWIAVGTPMILQELEGLVEIPTSIRERYRRMMEAVIACQRPDGLWTTIMDQPDFYPETSGSAGIATGILKACRMHLLDDAYRENAANAMQGVTAAILATGEVTGVSGGTPVMPSLQAYNEIPCYPSLYGQGLVLMLLAEALRE